MTSVRSFAVRCLLVALVALPARAAEPPAPAPATPAAAPAATAKKNDLWVTGTSSYRGERQVWILHDASLLVP